MTVKQAILSVISCLVLFVMGSSLLSSWTEPQVTGQLQLYQSNLLLQASEWQGQATPGAPELDLSPETLQTLRQSLLGKDPIDTVIEQYESIRKDAATTLSKAQESLQPIETLLLADKSLNDSQKKRYQKLQTLTLQQQSLINDIDLKLGLLETQRPDPAAAQKRWQQVAQQPQASGRQIEIAQALSTLWDTPKASAPNAEALFQTTLSGWFRYRALEQLYQAQQQPAQVATLAQQEQIIAGSTLVKLALIGALPTIGAFLGTGLLMFLGVQWLLRRSESILSLQAAQQWQVSWNGEIIWQVLVAGFFFVGQILIPIILGITGFHVSGDSSRGKALAALGYYLFMAGGCITVLVLSLKAYRPLPEGWFRIKWFDRWPLWGLGGYLVALPLMIGISLLNQPLWQGQGGNNPLLQTVLEENDSIALGIFLFTAAVAAPVFEEILFRGFLMPSLTKYLPTWGAIATSGLIFATAHLSLSEVLPLTVLGSVLGFVYVRSGNLLAPMLLHSAWNSVTMMGLFLLGSG
jgi:uncharacterized protein